MRKRSIGLITSVLSKRFGFESTPTRSVIIQHIAKETGWKKPGNGGGPRYLRRYFNEIVRGLPEIPEAAPKQAKKTKKSKRVFAQTDAFLDSREWKEARYLSLKRHGGACLLCGRTRQDGVKLHVDHIKPRSVFPELALDQENLQPLCGDCNQGKSNTDQTDWR